MSRNRNITDNLAEALRTLLKDPTARDNAELLLRIYDANHLKLVKGVKHFVDHKIKVEDYSFATIGAAYAVAKQHGYNGSEVNFGARLRTKKTWAEMIKPVDPKRVAAQAKTRAVKRDDMAKVIRGMK